MTALNVHEAKTHFSRVLTRVESGEEVVIARGGKPIARVVPYDPEARSKRKLGFLRGQIDVPEDFDTMFQKEIEGMLGELTIPQR
ncbi:type II toxin-antitoxin system Phd/YefM family antitoxin [Sphingomonas sp. SUN039]|uniref:type II toxin-antitoxin system Phd/YefM family antitoxin n=1 Tax=Sphingomonas sp. SUN039 TaxID=2937787 RepID=UPI002164CC39|nr:type II toxin-antitoxin system Phd/YefM family antitoxin [Sphingomonas sp. SUN039]UVO54881.1 type II toxin-antitoxin system Phd/YefM family antitoxin [Sphingomonas sp. SUN039]